MGRAAIAAAPQYACAAGLSAIRPAFFVFFKAQQTDFKQ